MGRNWAHWEAKQALERERSRLRDEWEHYRRSVACWKFARAKGVSWQEFLATPLHRFDFEPDDDPKAIYPWPRPEPPPPVPW